MVKSLFAGLILALCYLLKCLAPPLKMQKIGRAPKKVKYYLIKRLIKRLKERLIIEADEEADGQAKGKVKGEVEGGFEGGLDVEAQKGPLPPVQRGTRRNA